VDVAHLPETAKRIDAEAYARKVATDRAAALAQRQAEQDESHAKFVSGHQEAHEAQG